MRSVPDQLRDEIEASGGTIPFERFVEVALYGERGFYTRPDDDTATSGRAGRRGGDFITSPEVGPLFGAVVARWLDAEWQRLDRPGRFRLIDAGAGPGTLVRSVLAATPRCGDALDVVAVEVSAPQRARHPDGVTSVASLDELDELDRTAGGPVPGCVIANELLDNLPFGLLVFDGGWREALVAADGDRFVERVGPRIDDPPPWLPARAAHGARVPVQRRTAPMLGTLRATLEAGSVVVVDYAVARSAELSVRPWREWLRTYRGHERGGHYLADPGAQDVTVEVALDQLPPPDAVRTQAQWLQRWGIDELVEEGRRVWTERAARPDVEALRMRSRVSEAEALLDPAGLGGFTVAEWRAGA